MSARGSHKPPTRLDKHSEQTSNAVRPSRAASVASARRIAMKNVSVRVAGLCTSLTLLELPLSHRSLLPVGPTDAPRPCFPQTGSRRSLEFSSTRLLASSVSSGRAGCMSMGEVFWCSLVAWQQHRGCVLSARFFPFLVLLLLKVTQNTTGKKWKVLSLSLSLEGAPHRSFPTCSLHPRHVPYLMPRFNWQQQQKQQKQQQQPPGSRRSFPPTENPDLDD